MNGQFRNLLFAVFLILFTETFLCDNAFKKPTVLVGLLIRNKAHTLPYFLSLLEALDYPKDRMTLCIRSDNNIDNTLEVLHHWLSTESKKYHAIDLLIDEKSSGLEDEESMTDWPLSRLRHIIDLREGVLNVGRKIWADYIFMLDADAFLTNPQTLNLLIGKKKTVVAPMLKSDGMYSNFWAGMASNYYYVRTERYKPIVERKEIGCHEVPMVHSALLINLQKLESDSLTYDFENLDNYDGPKDDIITFALSANISDVSLHVCNDEIYGYILVPLENHEPISRDIDQLINLKLELLGNEESLRLNENMKKFVIYPKKDTLGFDKVYMINLERRPERRARMEQCFEELGILSETINAVDGRTLNATTLDKWGVKIMPNYADPYHKRPMTMGEIGCFLSHYVIWKKAFDNNFNRIMVLEDDVRFEPFFRQRIDLLLKEIDRLQLEWDLIYLGRKKMVKQDESPVDGSKLLLQAGYSYWTIGYMLSQSGVKKLLDAKPLENMIPVDEYLPILFDRHPKGDWKEYFPHRNLVAYSVEPLAIYPTRYTGEIGYISDTEDSNILTVKSQVEGQAKTEL